MQQVRFNYDPLTQVLECSATRTVTVEEMRMRAKRIARLDNVSSDVLIVPDYSNNILRVFGFTEEQAEELEGQVRASEQDHRFMPFGGVDTAKLDAIYSAEKVIGYLDNGTAI